MRGVGRLGLRLSVLVSTYDNRRALQIAFAGLARQTLREFEVIVADDGSGAETNAAVESAAADMPFAVRAVWQRHEGFRKAAILNRAIASATGDYLLFLDGDCVPPPHWVETHVRHARRGTYLAGGKIQLRRSFADGLEPADVSAGALDRFGLWWWNSVQNTRRLVVSRVPGVRALFDLNLQERWMWRGENSSTFAEHLYAVGGFDEGFGYGFEDADLGHRLNAVGVCGRSLRYSCPVMHLDHDRPYFDRAELLINRSRMLSNYEAALRGEVLHGGLGSPSCGDAQVTPETQSRKGATPNVG